MVKHLVAVAISVTCLLGSWAPARAAFDNWRVYTYASSSCSGTKDPLNFFYEGNVGHIASALALTQGSPLNWSATYPATDQWFYNTGESPGDQCTVNWYNRMSSSLSPRYHTRMDQGTSVPGIGLTTASPMHHDVYSWCGDVANSFNSARDHAHDLFVAANYGNYLIRSYIGNTQAMQQCDGSYTASDGYSYELRK